MGVPATRATTCEDFADQLRTALDTAGPTVIEAIVPLAEIANYSTELRSITGGEGSFSMAHDHYDAVPGHIAEGVISKAEKAKHPEDED